MNNTEYERKISVCRRDIDLIDKELVSLLERRMNIVTDIGRVKKRYKVDILDSSREAFVIENRLSLVTNKSYIEAIKDIFIKIMEVSRNIQF